MGVLVSPHSINRVPNGVVVQDEMGYLWADGSAVPQFRMCKETDMNPGALVCWTDNGLGLWVHPKSLRFVGSSSRLTGTFVYA